MKRDERRRDATRSDADPGERLLSDRHVADRLGVHRATVWKLVARGELVTPVHVGRSARWRARDIDLYIRSLAA